MPLFKLDGEYAMPEIEFTVFVEAKDQAEADKLLKELRDWDSRIDGAIEDEIHEALIERRGGHQGTQWNFANPVEKVPEGATVVKLPDGWDWHGVSMTSVRQIRCPNCDSLSFTTERLEKNNHSLNVRAKLTCKKCGHVWECNVSNPDHRVSRGRLGLP